ncbi:hypothetical protein GQ44DRAFT_830142 [Phaeosphaeriaceae sp. PMI808]|nr:hypothetical protein GQ44DRAFT_830142 [Phaeosphaeriaceae sp. PMI808]
MTEKALSGDLNTLRQACPYAARLPAKRNKVKILKGEFRIGTNTLFQGDGESRWYMAWRHWGCVTKHQILGLKSVTENDPQKAAGYDRLSAEAQEQVQLAFENGGVVGKEFKDIRVDLAGRARHYGGDILNATGYKVDIAARGTAGCRNDACPQEGVKISKGSLRLGICIPFNEDYDSWVYKHWKCMSEYDLTAVQERCKEDMLDGTITLPEEYQKCVVDTLEKGEVMDPPQPDPVSSVKPRKRQAKKKAVDDSDKEETKAPKRRAKTKNKKKASETESDAETPKPQPKRKGRGKKRTSGELEDLNEEH